MADTDDTARRLDEIRDREQRASPGPWSLSRIAAHDSDGEYCGTDNYLIDANREEIGGLDLDDDAEFAAHARADIPFLRDLVAARDGEITELKEILGGLCEDSSAAELALRYRLALERIIHLHSVPFPSWGETAEVMVTVARDALGEMNRASPLRPLTPREAEDAYNAAPAVPISEERIAEIVRYATGQDGGA